MKNAGLKMLIEVKELNMKLILQLKIYRNINWYLLVFRDLPLLWRGEYRRL